MLINVRISELVNNTSNSIPLAIIIGIYFNYVVYEVFSSKTTTISNYLAKLNNSDHSYMINTDLVNNLRYFNKGNIFFVTSKT
jgi:hypothetical protein